MNLKNILTPRFYFISIMIIITAFSRIIPHPINFSPICAIAIFGAASFNKKSLAFIIPIFSIWISDLFINNVIYKEFNPNFTWFYDGFYYQYVSYILIVILTFGILKTINLKRIVLNSLTATAVFFLISNFGCWVNNPIVYPQNFAGLLMSYGAGLPFIANSLISDLLYSITLFGILFFSQKRIPILIKSK